MSVSFIKKSTAKKCPIHTAIVEQCAVELGRKGFFAKEKVITFLYFNAIEYSIRWDYIVDFIREKHQIELVPMAQRFFKSIGPDETEQKITPIERQKNPGLCIATGHGKKTYGYASMELENGIYALKIWEYREGMRNGMAKSFNKYLDACANRGIACDDTNVKQIK